MTRLKEERVTGGKYQEHKERWMRRMRRIYTKYQEHIKKN